MSNKQDHVHIMDIPFLNKTKTAFLKEELYPRIHNNEKTFIVTANPEIVMETKSDAQYKAIVQSAHYVVADGIGIVFAAKYQKNPLQERITGFDLMVDLLKYANDHGLSCYLLGAAEEVNEKAVTKINERFPNVEIVGHYHGYFSDDDTIVKQIQKTSPDLIFVALGFPKQEYWIKSNFQSFSKGMFIGVGGSFDVLAGEVKRAPEIWIKLHLEWLYRLIKQPTRIKRIINVFKFMLLTLLKRKK